MNQWVFLVVAMVHCHDAGRRHADLADSEVFSWNIYVLAGGAQREVTSTWLETVFLRPFMIPWMIEVN